MALRRLGGGEKKSGSQHLRNLFTDRETSNTTRRAGGVSV